MVYYAVCNVVYDVVYYAVYDVAYDVVYYEFFVSILKNTAFNFILFENT